VIIGPAVLVGALAGPVAGAAFPLAAIAGLAAANGDGRGTAWQFLPLMGLGGAAVAATADIVGRSCTAVELGQTVRAPPQVPIGTWRAGPI